MISPLKLLFYVVVVTACVAYFGDSIVVALSRIVNNAQQTGIKAHDNFSDGSPVGSPDGSQEYTGGDIYIPIDGDGHYWITLDVNGQPIRFMVDTGASHITFSYEDAEAAGLNPATLEYNQPFTTANGVTQKAMVNVDHIYHGSMQMYDLNAAVSGLGQMDVSLLGMNFLSRLAGFNMENGVLILQP